MQTLRYNPSNLLKDGKHSASQSTAVLVVGEDSRAWEWAMTFGEAFVFLGVPVNVLDIDAFPATMLANVQQLLIVFAEQTAPAAPAAPAALRPVYLNKWNQVLFTRLESQPLAAQWVSAVCLGSSGSDATRTAHVTLSLLSYYGARELSPIEYPSKTADPEATVQALLPAWSHALSYDNELLGAAE